VPHDDALVSRVLAEARADVQAELERVFARRRRTGYGPLYDLLADYPFHGDGTQLAQRSERGKRDETARGPSLPARRLASCGGRV
jgi:hypothetical protein